MGAGEKEFPPVTPRDDLFFLGRAKGLVRHRANGEKCLVYNESYERCSTGLITGA